ncbi:FeoA family protein [Clostridium sp.]|uniref:FeoA family protein n=2 Tax=Clostridium sp. TaxID=1506 RepID=UPI003454674B
MRLTLLNPANKYRLKEGILMKVLNNVEIGKSARVENITASGLMRERMLAIGLTKGAEVEAVRRGPWGDPTVYNIRGAMIALREDEASLVHVSQDNFTEGLSMSVGGK